MEHVPTVVAGFDGSPAALKAVRFAAEETARRDAVLRILHVREGRGPEFDIDWDAVAGITRGYVDQHRVAFVDRLGWPLTRLMMEADRADLLVVGKGKHYRIGDPVGSVAQAAITSAGCPVVVITGHDRSGEDLEASGGDVVAGLKHLDAGESILKAAFDEAELRSCGLTVVHTWRQVGEHPVRSVLVPIYQDPEHYRREVLAHLGAAVRLVADKYPGVPVSVVAPHAGPAPALTEAAAGASVLVLGTPRCGSVRGMIAGSAGHALMRDARCPVMFVPR